MSARPTPQQWLSGARPRTLPAAAAPVLVGTGAAGAAAGVAPLAALLALVVALALQIGVNYANDYSDGVRGTDADRVGPFRLVGSGSADPVLVREAAFGCLALAGVAGLVLVVVSGQVWMLVIGAAAIVAAWYYTGGAHPYGYAGFGELAVFVFFGLVAVCGTTLVQAGSITSAAVLGGVGCGALSCALLAVNNLRDIPSDEDAGKRTLAVRLGDARTRLLYTGLVAAAFVAVPLLVVALWHGHGAGALWVLLGLLALPWARVPLGVVRRGATGRDLVPVLAGTGRLLLAYAVLVTAGLLLA